jgi:hypothetical protein
VIETFSAGLVLSPFEFHLRAPLPHAILRPSRESTIVPDQARDQFAADRIAFSIKKRGHYEARHYSRAGWWKTASL